MAGHVWAWHLWAQHSAMVPATQALFCTSLAHLPEPNEVRNLEVVGQTNNSIAFSWMAPEGPTNLMYKVSWFLSETHNRQDFTNRTNFTAEGLTPGTCYQFLVRSMTEDEAQSLERAINASTGEAQPQGRRSTGH